MEAVGPVAGGVAAKVGVVSKRAGRAKAVSRKERRECFMGKLFFEEVFEGLAGVAGSRRSRRRRAGRSRLRV